MSAVLDIVLPVFGLIVAGALMSRSGLLDAKVTEGLNLYVVWLALPALLFGGAAKMRLADLDHPGFVAAAVGGMLATFGASLILERGSDHRLADRVVDGLGASYANNGYLGIPLCLALFGGTILPALVISIMSTAVLLFGLAILLIEFDLAAAPSLAATLRKAGAALRRNPLLVAPAFGLLWAFTRHPLPAAVDRFVTLLADSAGPCALVTIGLFLEQQESYALGRDAIRLTLLKLFVQPAITYAIGCLVPMPRPWLGAAVLLAVLPTGTGPFMLAKLYDRDATTISRAILISTIVSVATVSLLVVWIEHSR